MLACTSDAVAMAHLILGQQCSGVTRAFTGAKACEACGCCLCLSILILFGQLPQLVVRLAACHPARCGPLVWRLSARGLLPLHYGQSNDPMLQGVAVTWHHHINFVA